MRNAAQTQERMTNGRLRSIFLGKGFAFFSATDEEHLEYQRKASAEGLELNDYLLKLWNQGEFKENPASPDKLHAA